MCHTTFINNVIPLFQNACGAKIQICRTLMNRPEVVSIGMVWDSERPSVEHVAAVYNALGTELRPTDAFHACVDRAWAARATHRLVGLVTYYGKHYSTFFYHSKLHRWIYFDDADVKEVGPEWSQVVDKCRRGRFQPLLLLYAAADGTPCDTRHAPKEVVPFPAGERRAVTPAPERPAAALERRAITPGPETVRAAPEPALDAQAARRAHLARSLSSGSACEPEQRGRARRDSGNWSGDRNSASSGSSAADSPYLYARRGPGSVPGSPTRKGELSSGGSCDAGYDSYSLSSTDSLPPQQAPRLNFQLAQIPEIIARGDCEALCMEAERLLEQSSSAEAAGDCEAAAMLCDAAASKARAAMDAPYNNPHTMTFARMKHNSCLMRARSLQRRVASRARAEPPPPRNTRTGIEPAPVPIEIYATLPKKKGSSKKSPKIVDDDIDVIGRERPPRHKSRDDDKAREKRSRSEDRGRARKEAPVPVTTEKKEEPPTDDKKNKKQHKIRRKLMGGLIRRKNRSMPDLTEGADGASEPAKEKRVSSIDDAEVGRRTTDDKTNLSGYLSEGHLEYSAPSVTNPTLERSKLMRKSFHGSAGKMLTVAKVPPPPPLRTTSQLTASKYGEHQPGYRQETEEDGGFSEQFGDEPQSMPFLTYEDNDQSHYDSFDNSGEQNFHTVVTKAMIHQEQSPVKRDPAPNTTPANHIQNLTSVFDHGVDVVDCAMPSRPSMPLFELPPYPSPMNSVNHSRQPSEEFPPPPSPINMTSVLDEINRVDHDQNQRNYFPPPTHNYNHYHNMNEDGMPKTHLEPANTVNSLLKELQAKQVAFKLKRSGSLEGQLSSSPSEADKMLDSNIVRNMASRFENSSKNTVTESDRTHVALVGMGSNRNVLNLQPNLYVRRTSSSSIDPNQMEDENIDQKIGNDTYGDRSKPKKKSVSFCDQVILVSTAEDQEDDSYIPNPILERVLKSAMNKPELTTLPLQSEKPSLQRQDSFDSQSSRSTISSLSQNSAPNIDNTQVGYNQPQHEYTSAYQLAQSRIQQQYNAQKSTGVYGTNSPVQMMQNQNNNQIYQTLPTAQHATSPIPYTQPPAYNGQSSASPPNFSQNPANRMTPTSNLVAKPTNNLPRSVPNTYPHPPSQLHQMNQPPNNAYYHRLPPSSQPSALATNYNTSRPYNQSVGQYSHNAPSSQSPYQSVPSNSPSYMSYHNPPTSYASSEYSSRYPQTPALASTTTPSPYQRVPPPHGDAPLDNFNSTTYQPIKMSNNYYHDVNSNQPRPDSRHYPNQQQRPMYNQNVNEGTGAPNEQMGQYQYSSGYNPYQHLQTKQLQKKSVSFEPGTKGGTDSPVPPQMTPYSTGDPSNFLASAPKLPCNLCRKKLVNPPSMYCPDCDFYMSRFKPKS